MNLIQMCCVIGNFVSKSDVFKANVCSHCLRLVLVETEMFQVKEY